MVPTADPSHNLAQQPVSLVAVLHLLSWWPRERRVVALKEHLVNNRMLIGVGRQAGFRSPLCFRMGVDSLLAHTGGMREEMVNHDLVLPLAGELGNVLLHGAVEPD